MEWTTVAVGLITSGAALGGSAIVARAARGNAREQRSHDAALELERSERATRERQQAYQVETLLELQLALHRLGRASGAVHHSDVVHHRTTGEPFGRQRVGESWAIEAMEAAGAVRLLVGRVRDPKVQEIVEAAAIALTSVGSAKSEEESLEFLDDGFALLQGALGYTGELIRELPAPSEYRPIVTSPFSPADREAT